MLPCLLLMAIYGCKKGQDIVAEEAALGPLKFVSANATGFAYGESVKLSFTYDGALTTAPSVSAPAGWTAAVDKDTKTVTVKAPAAATESAAYTGEITLSLAKGTETISTSAAVAVLIGAFDAASVDFKQSEVYNVMNGNVKIAELCREVIFKYSVDATMKLAMDSLNPRGIVAYPYKASDKSYNDGILVQTGGVVLHDGEKKAYTAPEKVVPVTKIGVTADSKLITNYSSTGNFSSTLVADRVTDNSGNSYKIVKVGTGYWMGSNLKTRKYNDGSAIGNEPGRTALGSCDAPDAAYAERYGLLYNYNAVKNTANSGIAPSGWHVGVYSNGDWEKMITFLGEFAGSYLKSMQDGGSYTNGITGMNCLLGGLRQENGTFNGVNGYGSYWTADGIGISLSVNSGSNGWLASTFPHLAEGNTFWGENVRCVRNK